MKKGTTSLPNKKPKTIINQLQTARRRNNKNWMDLVRLGFECDPKKAKKIMKNICKEDKKIMRIARKLAQ